QQFGYFDERVLVVLPGTRFCVNMSAYYPQKNPYEDEIPVIFIPDDVDISTLPDQCLMLIFDLLPIRDLICASQVCQRWNNLNQEACLRRKSLTIFVGTLIISCTNTLAKSDLYIPFSHELVDDNGTPIVPQTAAEMSRLKLPRLDNRNTFWITRKFANISHLELVFDQNLLDILEQYMVMYLLNHWRTNLVSFK